jgi:hypothetical protein
MSPACRACLCYGYGMTRQQVAKRLGKSLATVRRLEGVRLRPTQDSRGVHHFDPDEVEALARDIDSGSVALWQELRPGFRDSAAADHGNECDCCAELEQEADALRDLLEQQRLTHRRELTALEAEHNRQRAKHEAEALELATQVNELLASLDD